MAKLTDEQRALITELDRLYELAFRWSGPKYSQVQCRVCGWAANGMTLDEAADRSRIHEYGVHLDLKTWDEYQFHLASFPIAALHDHDCPETFCSCDCGCGKGPYCGIIGGSLCFDCVIATNRGEHDG